MLRSVLAVLTGYLIYAIPTVVLYRAAGQAPSPAEPPNGIVLAATLQGILFACLGGYVAAWIARVQDRLHAGVVALIIATSALLQAFGRPDATAGGAPLTVLFFISPSAFLGGLLRSFQDEGRH